MIAFMLGAVAGIAVSLLGWLALDDPRWVLAAPLGAFIGAALYRHRPNVLWSQRDR